MRRVLIIFAAVVAGLAALLAGAWLWVFESDSGRQFVKRLLEDEIGSALNCEARIGALSGDLPHDVQMRNLALKGPDGDWLTIERLALRWRPLALVNRRIVADRLALSGVDVLGRQPEGAETEDTVGLRLPDNLPDVTIGDFSVDRLRVSERLAGAPVALDATGKLAMGGRAVSLRLDAKGERDAARASIAVDPKMERALVEVIVRSEPGGALAALAGARDLDARIEGEGPVNDLRVLFSVSADGVGAVEGALRTDLDAADRVEIDARGALGEKFAGLAKTLGAETRIDAELVRDNDIMRLAIRRLESQPGALRGGVAWTQRHGDLLGARADLTAEFAPDFRTDIQELIGGSVALAFSADRRSDAYDVDARVASPFVALSTENARSDLAKTFAGRLRIDAAANPAAPTLLAPGFTGEGGVKLALQEKVEIEDLRLTVADGSRLALGASADLARRTARSRGRIELSPAALATLVENATAQSPAVVEFTASGPFDDVRAAVDISTPQLEIGGGTLPALSGKVRARGLPERPVAEIEARSRDGALRLAARVDRSGEALSFRDVLYAGPKFRLAGSGTFADDSLALDLRYSGEAGAEPWPKTPLAGDLSVKGRLSHTAASDFVIEAPTLSSKDVAAENLALRASGPSESVRIRISADTFAVPRLGPLAELRVDATAHLKESRARLTGFTGRQGERQIALAQPATLRWDETFAVEDLSFRIGADGLIALDGELSPTRWRARLNARALPLQQAQATADLSLDLDTDRARMAKGSFRARSLLLAGDETALGGSFTWDGRSLRVIDDGRTPSTDIDLTFPLALRRAEELSVAFEGPVEGRMTYNGQLQTLAPFLPNTFLGVEGGMSVDAALSGTTREPIVDGTLTLADAAYTELSSGLSLVGIDGRARASARGRRTEVTFSAKARGPRQEGDSVTIEGSVTLAGDDRLDAVVTLDRAALAAPPIDSATVSGSIRIEGPLEALTAKGALDIAELNALIGTRRDSDLVEIEVVAANDLQPAEAPAALEPPAPPVALVVKIEANDRAFVRGRGLLSEWSADLAVSGSASNPLVVGRLELVRGHLDFAGRRFALTRGDIRFDRLNQNNPALDIRAEYDAGETTAIIEIEGRAETPAVKFSSDPPLPQTDAMALVLFGKPASELSALEALQVAQALAQLGGVGPFGRGGEGLTGTARKALGLDMFNIDLGEDVGESSIEIGKYVARGLFVTVREDARGQRGAVSVEYEITPSISVETELRQDGEQTVSANWKRDF